MSAKLRQAGLVTDMWPVIRMMQLSGHYLFEYHTEMGGFWTGIRLGYSIIQTVLIVIQFGFLFLNLASQTDDVNDLAANTITVLFFTHSITKFIYFAVLRQSFYRTLGAWNTINSHPLFSESHLRYHAVAVGKIRRLILYIVIATLLSIGAWTGITFVGESTKEISDPDAENETMIVDVPRLMLRSYYPWDSMDGMGWITSFVYQFYWLFFTLFHANLLDTMFCCWLIFTCEQLVHLKEIMKPLVELSAALDTLMPHPTELFRVPTGNQIQGSQNGNYEVNLRGLYSNQADFNGFRNSGPLAMVDHSTTIVGPNGLSRKQEILVRSAIKYWVERHKHVVRFVGMIGDTYGGALLLHMLTSTITLTLLAYQATKIDGVDVYAASVIGYLLYTLGQVFLFCIFGNRLIEESSSVLEAAYSVEWYDGSEEAKTFIQIVCQQCQKPMSISGAKFFTVSLDLFASVLGAVVTYFMVLVQLN